MYRYAAFVVKVKVRPLAYLSGTQARHSTSKLDPKWRIQERQIPPLNGVTYYKSCP